MAEKNLPVNEVIELGYQAPNKLSGLSGVNAPIAEIYLPDTGSGPQKDSSQPDVELVEVGNTGTYRGEFTPGSQGEWQVIMHKADGDGQITRKYSVGAHNVHSVGEGVGAVEAKANSIAAAIDALPTTAEVDTVVDTRVDVTDAKIDALDIKVSELDTPPMAF